MTKKLNTLILTVIIFVTHWVSAEIVETFHMNEIHQYLKPGMLVIFDIDNTLIEPVQELGSNQWFEHRITQYASHGLSKHDALEKALREWTAIQFLTRVKLVESENAKIVQSLQDQGYKVMGLTTRGLGISTLTNQQLESVGIDFSATPPSQQEFHFMNGRGVLFRGGTLFTAGTHKGDALKQFLDRIDYRPESILFINDKESHIIPLEVMCAQEGINFIGLRYGYLDEKVQNLRTHIAEVQFNFFGHILSDTAAERILHENCADIN